MIPELRGRLSAGQEVLDLDLRDLQAVSGPGGVVLYALTGQHGGLSAYGLEQNGLARALPQAVFFSGDVPAVGSAGLVPVTVDGATLLMQEAGRAGLLTGYAVQPGGGPGGAAVQIPLPGGFSSADLVAVNLPGGETALYALDVAQGQLQGFVWDGSGSGALVPIAGMAPIPVAARGGGDLVSAAVGETQFVILAAGDRGPGTIASYHVDPLSGALQLRGESGAADGLGINTPSALETVTAHGGTWIILGAANSQSLSVLRLDGDGSLSATDHLIDSLHTRFGAVQAVAALEVDGHAFVVAGGGDDGLALFSLLPDGHLLHQASLAHATGLGLEDITAIELVRIGDELQIFVAGEGAPGVSQFTIPLASLGVVIRDTDSVATTHAGGDGDDLLVAGTGGHDRLFGGKGADTLVAGSDESDLTGGAGADLFVLRPATGVQRVMDFEPGSDRLDLSGLAMLRMPDQLLIESRADGARITFGDIEIQVFSSTGAPLVRADFWPEGHFHTADHFPVGVNAPPYDPDAAPDPDPDPVPPSNQVTGGAGNDTLVGTAADEILTGGAGPDTFLFQPGMGADTITDFVPGEDRLDFSALTPAQLSGITISQQGGNRVITLAGSSGLTLNGVGENAAPGGTVAVRGWLGEGQDLRVESWLHDGEGLGSFSYQWYRDGQAIGGALGPTYALTAADLGASMTVRVTYRDGLGTQETVLSPPSGTVVLPVTAPATAALVTGTSGRDFILSGAGNDTVQGLAGDDTLFGGSGSELLVGGPGNDVLLGLQGDNTVWSGPGNDYVETRLDNDQVWGAAGNDTLFVGPGDDTIGGGDGNDLIGAGPGNDQAWGGRGDDTIFGAPGNDVIAGAAGNDNLWGGAGDDVIYGAAGNDVVAGAPGNDTIWLGEGDDIAYGSFGTDLIIGVGGNDTIYAGEGDDTLDGGAGDDLLYGVGGADVFVFRAGDGADRIVDFEPGEDRLHIAMPGVGFADLQISAAGNGTRIDMGVGTGNGTLQLDGVSVGDLTVDDFIFGW